MQANISSIQNRDLNTIKSISDACFGVNYLTINKLNKNDLNRGVYSKAVTNNKLIGFCLAYIEDYKKAKHNFYVEDSDNDKYAIIKTLAITPNFQRKGYGIKLLQHVIHELNQQRKINTIYFPSWVESKSSGFTKLLMQIGFKEIEVYKKYWYSDSLKQNYTCIKCGNPPCKCSMQLFKLTI